MDEVQKQVLAECPGLKRLLETHGAETLFDYFVRSERDAERPIALAERGRQEELLAAFRDEVARLLGEEIAEGATAQLGQTGFVSTADHHGPLSHPFFLNANLVQTFVNRTAGKKYVLVLPCAGVSLSNSSYPRGMTYHEKNGTERRVHFLSWKYHCMPVWCAPDSYSDRMVTFNHRLWQHIAQDTDIHLIYLPQETLVARLLIRHHLDADTTLHRLLFDARTQESYTFHFDGVTGAFTSSPARGTFLFWGIKNGKRVALRQENLPHDPRTLAEILERREIMPSMALTFIVLSFTYGLTCAGGFKQIDYLGDMQLAWRAVLRDIGEKETDAPVVTNVFRGEFLLTENPKTALDLLRANEHDKIKRHEARARTLTLAEAMQPMMPKFYAMLPLRK